MDNPRNLPIELCENIIDRLTEQILGKHAGKQSRQSLLACCLTCRSWLPRSRFNLYSKVTLTNERQAQSFIEGLKSCPANGVHVTCLELGYMETRPMQSGSTWYQHPWVSAIPRRLSCQLKNLKSLHLNQIDPAQLHHDFYRDLGSFHKVESLTIWGIRYENYKHLLRFICAIRGLKQVTVASGAFRFSQASVTAHKPRMLPVSSVNIQLESFALTSVLQSPAVRAANVTSAVLGLKTSEPAADAQTAIRAIGKFISDAVALMDLKLVLDVVDAVNMPIGVIDFGHNSQLRTLEIRLKAYSNMQDGLSVVTQMISTLIPPNFNQGRQHRLHHARGLPLTTVYIVVKTDGIKKPSRTREWEAFDAVVLNALNASRVAHMPGHSLDVERTNRRSKVSTMKILATFLSIPTARKVLRDLR